MPSITGIRLSPHGIDATLINISETGLLVDCAERLKPGTAVTVNFVGTTRVPSVQGRVSRIAVSMATSHDMRYHLGIHFNDAIALPEEAPPAAEPAERTTADAPPPVRNRW